jgi:hypothetical protein
MSLGGVCVAGPQRSAKSAETRAPLSVAPALCVPADRLQPTGTEVRFLEASTTLCLSLWTTATRAESGASCECVLCERICRFAVNGVVRLPSAEFKLTMSVFRSQSKAHLL